MMNTAFGEVNSLCFGLNNYDDLLNRSNCCVFCFLLDPACLQNCNLAPHEIDVN